MLQVLIISLLYFGATLSFQLGLSYHQRSSSTNINTNQAAQFILYIHRRRQILEPHHADEIITKSKTNSHRDTFESKNFQDYVKVVCSTSSIPRKELYEAWASAVLIQQYFPRERRIADLACGHGLLSWALLLLDLEVEVEAEEQENGQGQGQKGKGEDTDGDKDKIGDGEADRDSDKDKTPRATRRPR